MRTLDIRHNKEVTQALNCLGRLPTLKVLYAGTQASYVENIGFMDWTSIALAKQLRKLSQLWIGKEIFKLGVYNR